MPLGKSRRIENQERAKELSRRVNLLLDVVVAEGGDPYTFADISAELKKRGVEISRARWYYLREGDGALVTDARLLEALADVFGVPAGYLLEANPGMPHRVEAQLELLRSMRKAQVKDFAFRALEGVYSPESVKELARIIDEELNGDD